MPSINEVIETLEPIVQAKLTEAVLEERVQAFKEIRRFARQAGTVETVVWWCDQQIELARRAQDEA